MRIGRGPGVVYQYVDLQQRKENETSGTYPEGKDVLIVGFAGLPAWVLVGLVGWDQMHVVERAVEEIKTIGIGAGGLDL